MASTKDLETVIKDHNNNDKKQVYRGRFLNFDFAIKIDEQGYLIKIAKGLVVSVTPLEKTKDKPLFTYSASSESWDIFSQKYPPPGYQDVMAMVECGHAKLTGEIFPVLVNLFFVCLSEEAFFRGFIQRELTSALQGMRYGSAVAIAASASSESDA